ncbi:hypothetical protein NDU88_003660 [Pleurodeles waltl]|uniref:Uncharacterized protein n=1 Tax=Pleurodeles waltl TaxID=8319 RepID=A0AAV7RJ60_PLEWA|nr:hypothetical protein NDU88_003660 [Pleurodeles waltl]
MDQRVFRAMELLKEAGRLDLIAAPAPPRERPVRRAASGVAAAVAACSPPRGSQQEFLESGARRRRRVQDRIEDVITYMLDMIDKRLSKVSMAGKLAGIAFMGKLLWGYAPSAGEFGQRLLEGWARERGGRARERRPISLDLLRPIMASTAKICKSLEETLLFRTLMSWMFFGAFRVSELLGSKFWEGGRWDDVCISQSGVGVFLNRSKTDQRKIGRQVFMRAYPVQDMCPMRLTRRMQGMGWRQTGLVFCHRNGDVVSAYQLLVVMRSCLNHIGVDSSHYGTHSFWIGMATEAGRWGWQRAAVLELGRWKSDAYRKYVR